MSKSFIKLRLGDVFQYSLGIPLFPKVLTFALFRPRGVHDKIF